MRRIATATALLLLAIGACTNPLDTPTDLQEEIAPPGTVRANTYIPGSPQGAFNPAGFVKTLQPGETDGQTVQVTVFSPVITSLTLEVCNEDKVPYAGWLQSVMPQTASIPPFPGGPPAASFNIVVGPPSGAEIKTHLFKICAVGNGTTFVANQHVTIVIPDITPPVITLLHSDPPINQVEVGATYDDPGATASDNVDGDITASISTDNPVDTNVLGTYTVTYTVSDEAGNPALPVTRTVTVVPGGGTPPSTTHKAVVEDVIARLSPLVGESRKLRNAVRHLDRSLEDRLWLDGYPHPRHGKKAFDRQKNAVKDLKNLLRRPRGASDDALGAATLAIDALVSINRQTALDAIDGVPAANNSRRQRNVDKKLEKALKDMDKGDAEVAKDKFDKAINYYRNAWKHAINATKEAAK